jgi:hypothetical protein
MSLSQRLHNQHEKKMEVQSNDVEQLQNLVRQLKLLSKSQTALLKVQIISRMFLPFFSDQFSSLGLFTRKTSKRWSTRNQGLQLFGNEKF